MAKTFCPTFKLKDVPSLTIFSEDLGGLILITARSLD